MQADGCESVTDFCNKKAAPKHNTEAYLPAPPQCLVLLPHITPQLRSYSQGLPLLPKTCSCLARTGVNQRHHARELLNSSLHPSNSLDLDAASAFGQQVRRQEIRSKRLEGVAEETGTEAQQRKRQHRETVWATQQYQETLKTSRQLCRVYRPVTHEVCYSREILAAEDIRPRRQPHVFSYTSHVNSTSHRASHVKFDRLPFRSGMWVVKNL